jgi:hypothetical protein
MAIVYPGDIDTGLATTPSNPETTPLSSAGSGTRNHVMHHKDLGAAIVALQQNASFRTHDHSGDGSTARGNKLLWTNTHQQFAAPTSLSNALALADTDASAFSIHHTLGTSATQAAAGNHTHDYNGPSITNRPFFLCTSTTRPGSGAVGAIPPISGNLAANLGTMIYETDSNVVRVYARADGSGLQPASSSANPIWQILPVAKVPVLRAEARTTQEVRRASNHNLSFTHLLEDFTWGIFGIASFMQINTSNTQVYIPEPGIYDVRATIHWQPDQTWHDQSMVQVMVNGVDIGRKNWQFSRGPTGPWAALLGAPASMPGFAQTQEIIFSWRFQAGDYVTVHAAHNATRSSFLWYNPLNAAQGLPNKQICSLDVTFKAP